MYDCACPSLTCGCMFQWWRLRGVRLCLPQSHMWPYVSVLEVEGCMTVSAPVSHVAVCFSDGGRGVYDCVCPSLTCGCMFQ